MTQTSGRRPSLPELAALSQVREKLPAGDVGEDEVEEPAVDVDPTQRHQEWVTNFLQNFLLVLNVGNLQAGQLKTTERLIMLPKFSAPGLCAEYRPVP